MRLFIALNLPAGERLAIHEATRVLRSLEGIRWVPPENLHLTLVFLGELDAGLAATVQSALQATAKRHPPVALALGRVGAFPNERRPRVIWLGATGGPELAALQTELAQAMRDTGIAVESRPFRAHVTLGRARGSRPAPQRETRNAAGGAPAHRLRQLGETVGYERSVVISSVHLVRSELAPDGARYSSLFQAPLEGPA